MLLSFICLGITMAISFGVAKLPVFRAQPGKVVAALLALASVALGLLVGIVGYELALHAMGLTITGLRPVFVLALVVGLPSAFYVFSNIEARGTPEKGNDGTAPTAKKWLRNGLVRIWIFVSALCVVGFGIQLSIDFKAKIEARDYFLERSKHLNNYQPKLEEEKEKFQKTWQNIVRNYVTKNKKVPEELDKEFQEIRYNIRHYEMLISIWDPDNKERQLDSDDYITRIKYGSILIWAIPLGLGVLLFGINWVLSGFRNGPETAIGPKNQKSSDNET